jgi:very-short-patch-repair endonuclease
MVIIGIVIQIFIKKIFSIKINKCSQKDIWKYDKKKIKLIENMGYEILIIWEKEYKQNKEKTIQKCIDFINK